MPKGVNRGSVKIFPAIPSRLNGKQNPEYYRAYRQLNPEKRKQESRDYYSLNKHRWKTYSEKKALFGADAWRIRNRKTKFKHRYGITLEYYEELKAKQDGKCAICFSEKKKLFVDHDHTTGEIRGLLCNNCNAALGFINDKVEWLDSCREYLSGRNPE